MSVGSVSMKGVPVHREVEPIGSHSSRTRNLEETKKQLAEQLKRAQQSNPMNAAEEKRQESMKLQLDSIEKQALSLKQQQSGNIAPPRTPPATAEEAKDSYIGGGFPPSKATGVYSLGKDESGNPKILNDKPEASSRAPLFDESGAKRSDEDEKKTSSAKPSDEEDERDIAPEEEDEDEKSEKASDDKKNKRFGTVNTGKVNAEIRKLQQEKQRIAQALSKATGDDQKSLQKRLEAIDSELRIKDTDAYRKQNAEYSESNG